MGKYPDFGISLDIELIGEGICRWKFPSTVHIPFALQFY
jgi:hypothetical protein